MRSCKMCLVIMNVPTWTTAATVNSVMMTDDEQMDVDSDM